MTAVGGRLWATITHRATITILILLAAASAFVGLLILNRLVFLGAVALVATNVLTWLIATADLRAERDEARERVEAVPIGARSVALPPEPVPQKITPPAGLTPPRRRNPSRMWDPIGGTDG